MMHIAIQIKGTVSLQLTTCKKKAGTGQSLLSKTYFWLELIQD